MCKNNYITHDAPKKVFDIFVGGQRVQEIYIGGTRVDDVYLGGKSFVVDAPDATEYELYKAE